MVERPKTLARATGLFYLALLATGVFAQGFVADKLIVRGDAAATTANILTNRGLYQSAFTLYMVEMACQIAVTVLFYRLLRPVGRSAALLAMAWGLTGCVIKTAGRVLFLAPLFLLPDRASTQYLHVFSAEQLQAIMQHQDYQTTQRYIAMAPQLEGVTARLYVPELPEEAAGTTPTASLPLSLPPSTTVSLSH